MEKRRSVSLVPNCIRTILLAAHPFDIAICSLINQVFWNLAPACLEYAVAAPKNNVMLLRWAVDGEFLYRFLGYAKAARKMRDKDERRKFCTRKEREVMKALNAYNRLMLDLVLGSPFRFTAVSSLIIDLNTISNLNGEMVRARPSDTESASIGRAAARAFERKMRAAEARGEGSRDDILLSMLQGVHGRYGRNYEEQMAMYEAGYGVGYDDSDDDDIFHVLGGYEDDDDDEDDASDLDDFSYGGDSFNTLDSDEEFQHCVIQFADVQRWGKAVAEVVSQSSASLQHFAILDCGRCSRDMPDNWVDSSPASLYRNLRIDRLLTSMPNLGTLYAPRALFMYEKSFKNIAQAWKALAAVHADKRLAGLQKAVVACCENSKDFKMPMLKSFDGSLEILCEHEAKKHDDELTKLTDSPFANAKINSSKGLLTGLAEKRSCLMQIPLYLHGATADSTLLKRFEEKLTDAVTVGGLNRQKPLELEISPFNGWAKHTNDRLFELVQAINSHRNAEAVHVILSVDDGARLFGALKILVKLLPLFQQRKDGRRASMTTRFCVGGVGQLESAFADLKKLHEANSGKSAQPAAVSWRKYNTYNVKNKPDANAVQVDDAVYDDSFPDIEVHFEIGGTSTKIPVSQREKTDAASVLAAIRGWMSDAQDAKRAATTGQCIRHGDLRHIFYQNVKQISFYIPAASGKTERRDEDAGFSQIEREVMHVALGSVLEDGGNKASGDAVEIGGDLQPLKRVLPFPKLKIVKEGCSVISSNMIMNAFPHQLDYLDLY